MTSSSGSEQDPLSPQPGAKWQFPESVGRLTRGKLTEYEVEPGQPGVAVVYYRKNAEITMYVRRLPAGAVVSADDMLRDTLAAIKRLQEDIRYSLVDLSGTDQPSRLAGWKGASFSSQTADGPLVSFVYCAVRNGSLFKLRATTGDADPAVLQQEIHALLSCLDQPAAGG